MMEFFQETLFWKILPTLLQGGLITLAISAASMTLALAIGLLVAFGRLARSNWLRLAANVYVEVIRGTPLLVQLFIVFYGLPSYGIRLDPITASILTLGLHYAAYLSEVYRAGILAVERGQWEAAQSIGMTRWMTMKEIILPQAVPIILPPMGNYFISMLKDSALTATISVVELLRAGQLQVAITFRAMDIYLIVAAMYFAMSYPIAILVKNLERRNSHGR